MERSTCFGGYLIKPPPPEDSLWPTFLMLERIAEESSGRLVTSVYPSHSGGPPPPEAWRIARGRSAIRIARGRSRRIAASFSTTLRRQLRM